MARQAIHSTDIKPEALSPIIIPDSGPMDRESESVVLVEKTPDTEYMDELAFMAQTVTLTIHPSNEENAPQFHDIYVNGKAIWVQVDVPTRVPRSYVEVLARAQPFNVQTQHEQTGAEHIFNRVIRTPRHKYAFTVSDDPAGARGQAWLQRVLRGA